MTSCCIESVALLVMLVFGPFWEGFGSRGYGLQYAYHTVNKQPQPCQPPRMCGRLACSCCCLCFPLFSLAARQRVWPQTRAGLRFSKTSFGPRSLFLLSIPGRFLCFSSFIFVCMSAIATVSLCIVIVFPHLVFFRCLGRLWIVSVAFFFFFFFFKCHYVILYQ